MKSDFLIAVTQLAAERGLPKESVVGAVEAALVSAYKKDAYAAGYNITVRLNPNDGEIKVYVLKDVVEEVTEPRREIDIKEARKYKSEAVLNDTIEMNATFPMAGRIAAQTAKQVVLQRLREAERELVLAEYAHRVGDILGGRVERLEPHGLVVSLGRTEALLPREETVPTERYRSSQTLQFYLQEVARTTRGPELILSRSHPNLVQRLFEREVPEIFNGIVEIKAVAREAGFRSKLAVSSRQEGVDPVGSCVGLRGIRIQNIVTELQGEKIDVIQWHEDPTVLIANALSPAQVLRVELRKSEQSASVTVPERQLSLAIGREGQNVRLAAKLTGWNIDILSPEETASKQEREAPPAEAAPETATATVVAEAEEVVAEVAAAPAPVETAPEVEAPAEVEELVPVDAVDGVEPEEALPEVSAEEEVLAEVEGLEAEPEVVVEPEPAGISADDERLWVVPAAVNEPSVLRFAEDILPGRGERSDRDRSRGRSRRGRRSR